MSAEGSLGSDCMFFGNFAQDPGIARRTATCRNGVPTHQKFRRGSLENFEANEAIEACSVGSIRVNFEAEARPIHEKIVNGWRHLAQSTTRLTIFP